ncbi:MAG: DUF5103 domain-containing protein [Bacteroidales bacterium]|nr:DUF5103 domain-containing protein [Bacteroidales bacterium]
MLNIFFFSSIAFSFAQTDTTDYYKKNYFHYDDYVYKNNIKTVLLHQETWEFSPPIIELNGTEKLKLSFDDLDGDLKNYSYTVVHCDANWQPSNMQTLEYIDGFTEDNIRNYNYSVNTIQKYTHYSFTFPNENLRLTKSGNYLLKIYLENDKENIAITRRFMIAEPLVAVEANVKRATALEYRDSRHEIDFVIKTGSYLISNPLTDLNVVITQNDRWDNAISNLKPLFIRGNELIYDYEKGNTFIAGNEFRQVDIRSLRYQSMNIRKITYDSLKNHVYLLCDVKRSGKTHLSFNDINGKFSVINQDRGNGEVEGDYAYVHFCLQYNPFELQGNVYLLGALTGWRFSKESQLKYNPKRYFYEATLYLKQGYYNYIYVLLKNNEKNADESYIEGSYYETENQYCIYVYYREPGTLYDKLIAYKKINS